MLGDDGRARSPEGVFGAELRHYREQAGLSQTELAALVNVSHDVISKIETGERAPARDFPERLDAVPELDTRGGLARLWGWLQSSAADVTIASHLPINGSVEIRLTAVLESSPRVSFAQPIGTDCISVATTVTRAASTLRGVARNPIAPPGELARYLDQWVAVRGGKVAANRDSPSEILDWIKEHGGGASFAVLQVPSSEDDI